jgi:uncharacterized iron-regulated membrane protein
MRKHWLFVVHKYIALALSLPLLLVALSGVLISLAPLFSSGSASPQSPPSTLAELLQKVLREAPQAQLMRGLSRGPGGTTAHLMINEAGKRQFIWSDGQTLKRHDLGSDFFYQNKQFHEGFLLSGLGKKIVAVSGLGLALVVLSGVLFWIGTGAMRRTKNLWQTSPRRLAAWHVVLGLMLAGPLLFQALTGSLIEFHGLLFTDQPTIDHAKPVSCTPREQLAFLQNLTREPAMVFFCRPDLPYLMVRSADGEVVQYTPAGLPVMRQSKEMWQGSPLTRKGFFVGLHEAKIFGKAHHIYNFIVGIALTFFIISGLVLWARKKFKLARSVPEVP